ncbi:MAG: hypothetical protein HQL38_17685, partial [Alphaproteobacteria bacterium]|nr:hypothetical protein [Alphaproteobacteria bacterium]
MRPLRALLLLLLILPLVAPGAAWAQGGTPRAAVHEGYARMVFDWDGPVAYSAEVVGGKLLVRFDK